MRRGAILEAVKKENRNLVIAVTILAALLAAVLAFNWKYMYNWAAGPFRFDAALAAAPDSTCPTAWAARSTRRSRR